MSIKCSNSNVFQCASGTKNVYNFNTYSKNVIALIDELSFLKIVAKLHTFLVFTVNAFILNAFLTKIKLIISSSQLFFYFIH